MLWVLCSDGYSGLLSVLSSETKPCFRSYFEPDRLHRRFLIKAFVRWALIDMNLIRSSDRSRNANVPAFMTRPCPGRRGTPEVQHLPVSPRDRPSSGLTIGDCVELKLTD
jgi:hypothetical protein